MKYYTTTDVRIAGHEYVNSIVDAEIMLVLQGDGNILDAVNFLVREDALHVPIFGINTGHLGFLSNNISVQQAKSMMDHFDNAVEVFEIHHVSERRLVEIQEGDRVEYGLNEVVIKPSAHANLFSVDVSINGMYISFKGDGLLVCTTSGSTAWNLSAGGPVMMPEMETLCVTPLYPFSLASRSVVVPGSTVINIQKLAAEPTITIDGRITDLKRGAITLSNKTVKLIKLSSFLGDIQDKLGWNNNIRK